VSYHITVQQHNPEDGLLSCDLKIGSSLLSKKLIDRLTVLWTY